MSVDQSLILVVKAILDQWDNRVTTPGRMEKVPKQRKEPRAPLSTKVRYTDPQGHTVDGFTETIGGGGLFIQSLSPLEKGTLVQLMLLLPGNDQPVQIRGRVVWVRTTYQKPYPPGMGIQFEMISIQHREQILECVTGILTGKNQEETLENRLIDKEVKGKQRHSRTPLGTQVTYSYKGSYLFGSSSNLSQGGIFIQTNKLVAVGTLLTLQFSLPNNPKNIRADGRVIWTTSGSSKQKAGMGIEFLRLRKDDEVLISNFVKMMGSAKPSLR